jgi:hypothetical protein
MTHDEAGPGGPAEARTDRSTEPGSRSAGVRVGLVMAAVFVLGLTFGAVAVGLLSGSTPPPVAATSDGAAGGGVTVGPFPRTGGEFRVNAACLGAVNAAQDAYSAIDELSEAAAALDAARLDEVVRRLQPLQPQLEEDLGACEVTPLADPSTGGSVPATPTDPAPTPTSPNG